jgi:DNA-binding transcriptional MerR regulator
MLVRIGKVSRELGVSVRRILQYEEEGLVKPAQKTEGGHRLFDKHDLQHIKNIMHLIHDCGLTLSGIKYLLKMAPCWKVFPCSEKERCTAYKNQEVPCWEIRKNCGPECVCTGECERCAVFMVRDFEVKPIFNKFPSICLMVHLSSMFLG